VTPRQLADDVALGVLRTTVAIRATEDRITRGSGSGGLRMTFYPLRGQEAITAALSYEKDRPAARIVLNLPERANIRTARQVWDIEDALKWANGDEEVKVLIVEGNGNGFCAGHAIVEPWVLMHWKQMPLTTILTVKGG
jgi:hypothetical protein